MPNSEMAEFWNTRGGQQWVREKDRYDTMLAPCGRRLLEAAALQEGQRVLDVGCGNGASALEAAARVGTGGSVVGVDLSGPMLETARRRASELGLSATFVQGDAQTIAFDASFDAVISRFGVMFFDDPARAFSNLAGALRPGGRMSFVCWQEMLANEWLSVPIMAAVGVVGMPDPPAAGAPGPFALSDPDRIRAVLDGAGLAEVEIDAAADRLVTGVDPDDMVSLMVADEMGRRLFEGRTPETVSEALAAVRRALEPHSGAEGVALGSAYWVVTARRP